MADLNFVTPSYVNNKTNVSNGNGLEMSNATAEWMRMMKKEMKNAKK